MTDYALLSNPRKHFYTSRNRKLRLIVLHVTAGIQDLDMVGNDYSAEKTTRYGQTTTRAASWHSIVDSDNIIPSLPDHFTAFHCRGYNASSLGLELCNTDARWDNKPAGWTEATLLNAAKVCLQWEKRHGIPRRLLTRAQVDAGYAGYTYHSFLDPSRRSDPGDSFPWVRFVKIMEALEKGEGVEPAKQFGPHVDRVVTARVQRLLKVEDDGFWGDQTDSRADLMLTACRSRVGWPKNDPKLHHIEGVQMIIGVEQDGRFGPISQQALHLWVRNLQRAIGVFVDGLWGPATDAAFTTLRQNNRGQF